MAPPSIYKFPRTPHVLNLGAATRDDLILDAKDALAFINSPFLIVEEKVDGANMGVSFDPDTQRLRFQKRGHYITASSEPQYSKLDQWSSVHSDALWEMLGTSKVLYGEWVCARHTVAYDKLPDWFLAFDILDLERNQFLPRAERDTLLAGSGLRAVRVVHKGPLASTTHLTQLLMSTKSAYCTKEVQAEGLYLRLEDGAQLVRRAKLVHPDFTQAIEDSGAHWSKRTLHLNCVRPDLWLEEEQQQQEQQPAQQQQHQHQQGAANFQQAQVVTASTSSHTTVDSGSNSGSMMDRIINKHGVICLSGPGVDAVAARLALDVPQQHKQLRREKFGPGHHITLVSPTEIKQLLAGNWSSVDELVAACNLELGVCINEWLPIGLGSCTLAQQQGASSGANTAFFCVVTWPAAQHLRAALGLPSHQFHITLGFQPCDVHGPSADKGYGSLVVNGPWWAEAGQQQMVHSVQELAAAGAAAAPVGGMSHASTQAAILLQDALELLAVRGTASVCHIPSSSGQALQCAAALVDVALALLAGKTPASAAEQDQEHAAVVVCAEALKARVSGMLGNLDEALAHATLAADLVPGVWSSQPTAMTAFGRQVHGVLAYALLLRGRALFGHEQFSEASASFVAAQQSAAKVLSSCSAGPGTTAVPGLMHKVWALFDATAVQQGCEACSRRLSRMAQTDAAAAAAATTSDATCETTEVKRVLSDLPTCDSGPLNPRVRYVVPNVTLKGHAGASDVTLQRNTSWLVPQQLLGSSTPKRKEQIVAVRHLGVRLVLTLTEEEPLPAEWFKDTGVRNVFVPTPNYEPPSVEQMDKCMEELEQCIQQGDAALVHCGGGKGRAGTVLACYMCKHGLEPMPVPCNVASVEPHMPAELSVRTLRAMRPGSIETEQQQRFVGTYAKVLWKRWSAAMEAGDAPGAPVQAVGPAAQQLPTTNMAKQKQQEQKQKQHKQKHKQQESTPSNQPGPSSQAGGSGSTPINLDNNPSVGDSLPTAAASHSDADDTSGWELPGGYPRTAHLPFSPQVASDDIQLADSACGALIGEEVVVTEKLDGGNCFIFQGRVYARSHRQETTHPWFTMAKGLAAGWSHLLPPHLAVVAENMQAVHSIQYSALAAPLYVLGVYDCARRVWGAWDEVVAVADLLGLPTVPLLFKGCFPSMSAVQAFMESRMRRKLTSHAGGPDVEGFVIRRTTAITPDHFGRHVAKFVRRGHVQTAADWTRTWKQAAFPGGLEIPATCRGEPECAQPAVQQTAVGVKAGAAALQHSQAATLQAQTARKGSPPSAAQDTDTAGVAVAGVDASASSNPDSSDGGEGTSRSTPTAAPKAGLSPSAAPLSETGSKGNAPVAAAGGKCRGKATVPATVGSSKQGPPKKSGLKLPKLIMLVGLPGSGKSTFADALVASGRGWVRVCQDECGGSRRTCESAFSIAALRGSDHGRHVILDRCNATADDRRAWLDLALIGKRDKGVHAVWFDVPPEECVRRVAARVGHPTLPPNRGGKAIASFAKVFQPPTIAEGFERLHIVRSFEEANALLASFGASKPVEAAAAEVAVPEAMDADAQQAGEGYSGMKQRLNVSASNVWAFALSNNRFSTLHDCHAQE